MLDIDLHVYHGMQTSLPDFEYPPFILLNS